MKIRKIVHAFFALIFISQLFVQPAYAQETKPSIAFINQKEIEYSTSNLVEVFEVQILNQSPEAVLADQLNINVYIIGLSGILSTDDEKLTINRGEIGTATFSIDTNVKGLKQLFSGFIAFGSAETGDFIYKTVTIDTRDKNPSAETKDVVLLTGDGDISLNWTDLENKKLRIPILNTSPNPATIKADLYFLDKEKVELFSFSKEDQVPPKDQNPQDTLNCQDSVGNQKEKTITGNTLCDLIFDLSSLSLENKRYEVFLIIQVSDEYFIHEKITLNFPSAKALEPPGDPQVEFLGGEDPIAINYGSLFADIPVEIGIINKGEKAAQVKNVTILIPGLVDKNGKKISPFLKSLETPFSIEAQAARIITIQLEFDHSRWTNVETRQIPKEGTYSGYLILTTDYDNAPLIKPLSLSVEAINPALPTTFVKLGEWIQLQWQKVPFTRTRFGAAEWSVFAILLALVLAWFFAFIRVVRLWWWNIRGRLGPVIVEDIEGKPDLTAKFRQYLATSGIIPATSVPNVAAGITGFVTVVSKSKIPEVAFIQAILDFIAGYLRIKLGYTVTSILVGSEAKPPVGVTVQIKMTQNGRLKRIETIEGDSYEQAVKNAAYFIFHYISGRKTALRHIPEWSRFPTHTSYRLYKEAESLKGSQEYHKAIKLYEEAAKEAPFNALLRLGWGDAHELKGEHLKALAVYLEAVSLWPHVLGFWYRISVILSYANKWYSTEWKNPENKSKNTIIYLLEHNISHILEKLSEKSKGAIHIWFPNYDGKNGLQVNRSVSLKNFIGISRIICDYLEEQVRFERIFSLWIMELLKNTARYIFKPSELKIRLPLYYWGYIPFWPWGNGKRFLRMAELSKNCNDVISGYYQNNPVPGKPTENLLVRINNVEKIARKPWNRMATYYNSACFYALLADTKVVQEKILPTETDMRLFFGAKNKNATRYPTNSLAYYQEQAMNLLKTANQDPRSTLDNEWVKIDPDLKSLHENLEFKALFDIPDKEETQSKETKEKKAKFHALSLVQTGAKQQMELMDKDKGQGLFGPTISQAELLAGADQQKRLWESLIKLAENPMDEVLQKLFWNLAMQYKNGSFEMPEKQDCQKSLDELDTCWKAIKNESQHLPGIWESHIADGKLYLEHGQHPMTDVWALWSKAEKRQWEYIDKHIEDFKKPKEDSLSKTGKIVRIASTDAKNKR